jgi:nucleotide-binding universal stress UspA family protein
MQAKPQFLHASSPLAEELYSEYPLDGPPLDELLARDSVLADAVGQARDAGFEAEAKLVANPGDSTDLACAIAGIAAGTAASMIVVGSRGRSSISGAVLGSVSHNLIKYATVPILVVHATVAEEAAVAE